MRKAAQESVDKLKSAASAADKEAIKKEIMEKQKAYQKEVANVAYDKAVAAQSTVSDSLTDEQKKAAKEAAAEAAEAAAAAYHETEEKAEKIMQSPEAQQAKEAVIAAAAQAAAEAQAAGESLEV